MSVAKKAADLALRYQRVQTLWPENAIRDNSESLYSYIEERKNKLEMEGQDFETISKEMESLEKITSPHLFTAYPNIDGGMDKHSYQNIKSISQDKSGTSKESRKVLLKMQRLRWFGPRLGGFINRMTGYD